MLIRYNLDVGCTIGDVFMLLGYYSRIHVYILQIVCTGKRNGSMCLGWGSVMFGGAGRETKDDGGLAEETKPRRYWYIWGIRATCKKETLFQKEVNIFHFRRIFKGIRLLLVLCDLKFWSSTLEITFNTFPVTQWQPLWKFEGIGQFGTKKANYNLAPQQFGTKIVKRTKLWRLVGCTKMVSRYPNW